MTATRPSKRRPHVTPSFDNSVGNGFHKVVTYDAERQRRFHASPNPRTRPDREAAGQSRARPRVPLLSGTFKANLALQDSPFYSTATYFAGSDTRYIADDSVTRNAELGLNWKGNIGSWEDEVAGAAAPRLLEGREHLVPAA